jgi:uncharacterized protein with FMN-binding domain
VRRGIKLVMSTATLVVVGVGLRGHAQSHPPSGATSPAAAGSATTRSTPPAPKPSGARTRSPSRSRSTVHPSPRPSTAVTVTVSGDLVQTDYGPVQVEISVRGGRITQARALSRPSGDGRTDSINSYAIPQLDQETLATQNAQIDTVSGATFTSGGYRQSLQSALDAAHRAGAK